MHLEDTFTNEELDCLVYAELTPSLHDMTVIAQRIEK